MFLKQLIIATSVLTILSPATPMLAGEVVNPEVDALFATLDQGVRPGAAVLVLRDGKVIHEKGYGMADLENETPITSTSAFRLASVSKQFAAVAIMLLEERGQLDLDKPAMHYLPVMKAYPDITVRHLLTHTGGMRDYYDEIDTAVWEESGEHPSNMDAIEFAVTLAPGEFEAGDRYEYSNTAYEVLPLIVESVSGQSFSEFMQEELFKPLGMEQSAIHDESFPPISGRVLGYRTEGGGFALYDYDVLNGITGAGGQYSSLEDFKAWIRAISGESTLSKPLLEKTFTQARLNDGSLIDYGMGFGVDCYKGSLPEGKGGPCDGYRRISHGGSWVGFRTHMSYFPDHGLGIVILSNLAEYEPGKKSSEVTNLFLD